MTAQRVELPARFAAALESMRRPQTRPEVTLREIPAPTRVAPYAIALEGEVEVAGEEIASGRLVVLHDPEGQEAWQGDFRVVTMIRASLEPEMASDPLLHEVAWSWVTDALVASRLPVGAVGGTVTRMLSTSFGALRDTPETVDLELRASWTALDTDLGAHLRLWVDLMSTVGGLPPLPADVTAIGSRRNWLW